MLTQHKQNEEIYFRPKTWLNRAIKPKVHKYPKLQGLIVEKANKSGSGFDFGAYELAVYGEELSLYPSICKNLYNLHWLLKNMRSEGINKLIATTGVDRDELLRQTQEQYDHLEKLVSSLFIQALLNHDKTAILELANAAEFFKGKIEAQVEPVYGKLLLLKAFSPISKEFTIREIAELVYGKTIKPRHDGYSRLRQTCKKLGIPIKPSKPSSRKSPK